MLVGAWNDGCAHESSPFLGTVLQFSVAESCLVGDALLAKLEPLAVLLVVDLVHAFLQGGNLTLTLPPVVNECCLRLASLLLVGPLLFRAGWLALLVTRKVGGRGGLLLLGFA